MSSQWSLGDARVKQELPSWFLEEEVPWWRGTVHPSEESEFVERWFLENTTTTAKGAEKGQKERDDKEAKGNKGKGKGNKGKAAKATTAAKDADTGKDGALAREKKKKDDGHNKGKPKKVKKERYSYSSNDCSWNSSESSGS